MTAPPGVGKSLLGWSYNRLLGTRGLSLTSTRGLTEQYHQDFGAVGMRRIEGMGNYPCRALGGGMKCDAGPCLSGEQCIWRKEGCDYFDAERVAAEASEVVSNYAYWFAHYMNPTLGARDLLIADEAHDLPKVVMQAAGAEFSGREIELTEAMRGWELEEWRSWAWEKKREAWELLESKSLGPAETREVRRLAVKLGRLAGAGERWAFEWPEVKGRYPLVRFEPISAMPYAEPLLFRGIPRVLLLSATVRKPTLDALGIPEEESSLYEAASPFPVARRPIYWLEIGLRITGKTSETNLLYWVGRIDQVIESRLHWKGIIHTVSYARARFLQKHSRFGRHMLLHDSSDTRDVVADFKRRGAPSILVSPSVHTGWDFPFDQARWQIIAKVPFPDTRGGIAKARAEADKQWQVKEAIATVLQMAGRVMRDTEDMGETFILDDILGEWLYPHFRPWFSRWFREAWRPIVVIPPPLVI